MDLVAYDDYDKLSASVRRFCAEKLIALESNLVDYVNGNMGDVTPGHVAAYINLIKELGRLYGTQKPPRDPEAMIPASRVAALLEAAEARIEAAVAEAALAAEARVRLELKASEAGRQELAAAQVRQRLGMIKPGG